MAHFAKVLDGKVVQVIVVEPEFMATFLDTSPGQWLQTSYNTLGGQHLTGGTPLRKNFAAVGYNYDRDADAFYVNSPYDSWVLDTETYLWKAPVEKPNDDNEYRWDELTTNWVEDTSF